MRKNKELKQLMEYLDAAMSGQRAERIQLSDRDVRELSERAEILLDYKNNAGESSGKLLDALGNISSFDVGLSYISKDLTAFAGNLADFASSNLATVEETTASMHQVNENIDEATQTLKELAEESNVLTDKNNKSQTVINEVVRLKENVLENSNEMKEQIGQLVTLVSGIENMVQSVQGIASQINLLALNASIEAARAGEHGKGFAVVADEVSKLADTTKEQLAGMQKFVKEIYTASGAGKDSVERVLESTGEMSEKIDSVSVTVGENIEMLHQVARAVGNINESMQIINGITTEVNNAMEQCGSDAENITCMSAAVKDAAEESVRYAEGIESIDDRLFETAKHMYKEIHPALSVVSNEEIIEILERAKDAHRIWINNVKEMVRDMKPRPLQMNARKCAFGRFYGVINIRAAELTELWREIGDVHTKLHAKGPGILQCIIDHDMEGARKNLVECEKISEAVIKALEKMQQKVKALSEQGSHVS